MTSTTRRHEAAVDERAGLISTRRTLLDRVTLNHVAPVLLGVIAAVLVAVALRDRSATSQIAVASRAIAVGAPVDSHDTRLVAIHSDEMALLGGVLAPANLENGWVATVPIAANDPITRSELAHPASGNGGLGSMSLPVPVANADGGQIVAGDTIDVIGNSGGTGDKYVAQGLRVLSVPTASSTTGVLTATGTTDYYIVVAVDPPTALRLSNALATSNNGQGGSTGIMVIRTTGESTSLSTGGS